MHDLKSPEGVIAYLKGTRFAASEVQPLSGGNSAFTYRVILETPLETGEETIVIKHYEGFVARMEHIKGGVERADHEYMALSAIATSGLSNSDSTVQLPQPIEYDQETHTIFMHDLGSPVPLSQVLEKGFSSGVSPELHASSNLGIYELASEIGKALGDFMGRFHNWSTLPEQGALHAYFAQKPYWEQMILPARHSFIPLSADRFQLRERWMDEYTKKEEQEASTAMGGGVLVMGDCSLHNILVSPPSEGSDMRIYLTDLEVARINYPEIDIGELTASAISFELLYYPGVAYPFVPALHRAYTRHRTLNARRIGVATGMDLMSFGALFPWARGLDEAKLKEVVVAGLELWKLSVREDEELIKANAILQHLFLFQSQQII